MSLLIKALEQAAKDRKTTSVEPTQPVPVSLETTAEPMLEPPPPPRSAATQPAREPAAPQRARETLSYEGVPRRPAASLAALANIDAQQQRARAAAVMQASGGAAQTVIAYLRGSPLMLLAAIGVICGIGFGIYVYLQISKPGLFVRQASTPAPAPVALPAPAGLPETGVPGPITAAPNEPIPAPGAAAPAPMGAPASSAPSPIASGSVIGTPSTEFPREPVRGRERGSISPPPETPRAAPRAARGTVTVAEPAAAPGRERISVSPTTAQPRLNPLLSQAYTLLQSGNMEEARGLYTRVSQAEPLNIDAMLGLAYIAAQENRSDDAMKHYVRILQLNPRHAVAQAALIGLIGRADPIAAESRMKQLIAREPAPFLHFILGNIYADQMQWAPAQQSYFQAYHLEPDNPDYAYNLAVGLDHLRQAKLALDFYRRAEQLAATYARANFNLSHARERIRALSSQLE